VVEDAFELARSIREGTKPALGALEESLAAIAAKDASIHAFLLVDGERARQEASLQDRKLAAGEAHGRLAGVPVAIKDNIATKGMATTCASRILEGWVPPYDATVVERLRAAGAVVVGKTNLDEFAMGSSTEYSAYGPTRNPHDTGRVPGGSSGGSAAAVAAGMVPISLGSDTGGSIRQPAAMCGVVGLKPTYGRVSRFGLVAFASSLDQIGPICRTVRDAALVLEVIGGGDPKDSTCLASPAEGFVEAVGRGVAGLRIGVVKELVEGASAPVVDAVSRAAEVLSEEGAMVEETQVSACKWALPAYYLIAPSEASSNLARYDGVRYGLRAPGRDAEEMMSNTRARGFGPEVKRRVMIGTYALSAGYYDAYYAQAQRVRTLIIQAFDEAYSSFDALLGATAPTVAFELGAKSSDPLEMYLSDVFTVASNLAGHPAISVPFGCGEGGLPVGVQVLGPALSEEMLFRVAGVLEAKAPKGGEGVA